MSRRKLWPFNDLARTVLAMGVVCGLAGIAPAEGFTMHARVSYDAGSNLVKGSDDKDWSHATLNTLLIAGDTLWVDEGGTSEVEFSGGTFLRAADGTKVDLYALPPTALLRGWSGSFYVQRISRSQGDFTVETPAAKIYVQPDTMVRVDIVGGGATTVSVQSGRVSVRAADGNGAVTLDSGERIWADPGMLPSEPTPYNAEREDALDSWNRERAALLYPSPRTAPKEVVIADGTIGTSDLDRYGEWVYVENRYCWRPTVVVNYVPYRYGYWNYVPTIGNCWVETQPFSYVTTHYGRWHHTSSYGWVWGYDPVWSPAWVATVRCGDYYVWSPVGFDYRPVSYGGVGFSIGGVNFAIGATSYVPVGYFGYGPSHVYGCYPEFGNYVNHATINIWNINTGNRNRIPVPYNRDVPTERDYTPRRSIRGLESIGNDTQLASQRVTQLERGMGRSTFAPENSPRVRNDRTVNTPGNRTAEVRQVRVSESRNADLLNANVADGLSSARNGRSGNAERGTRAERPLQTLEPRIGRPADDSGRPAAEMERPRVAERGEGRGNREATPTLTNEDARGTRPIPGDRQREVDGPVSTDTPRGTRGDDATTPRSDGGRTPRVPLDGNVEIERPTSRGESTPDNAVRSPRTRTVESDSEGGRVGGGAPRRTAVPKGDDPARTPSVTIRGRTPSGPSVDDVPTRRREATPGNSADWSNERSRTPRSGGSKQYTPAPQPERVSPRGATMERPSTRDDNSRQRLPQPSTMERSAPREVPQRSYEAPQPRVETPRPQYQAPQRSYEAPQRVEAPSPRVSAPREASRPQTREMDVPQVQRSAPAMRSGGGSDGGGRSAIPDRGSSRSNGRSRGER